MNKYIVASMMGALMFGGIVPSQSVETVSAIEVKQKNKKKKKKSYKNCTQARKAGVTPLYRGQRGYSKKLDRDRDGIACE